MRFRLVDAAKKDFPVARLCKVLEVSLSGSFAGRTARPRRASARTSCCSPTSAIEGTGSYGAGLTRALTAMDLRVIEVGRVNR